MHMSTVLSGIPKGSTQNKLVWSLESGRWYVIQLSCCL